MNTNNKTDLTVTRIIKAPRSAIWKAWAEPEHLAKWWAPVPVKTTVDKLELRAGGAFDFVMHMEDGTEHGDEACFLEVVENERIVWTSALQGGWRPNKGDMPFTAVITLEEHPEGTKYTATALHQNDEDRKKHADMGFVNGWGTAIDQLAKIAEELPK